jgi:hypothetical protein
MLIKDIDTMESIVSNHPDLEWEGWDVMWYKPYPAGFLKVDGAMRDGKWTRLRRIAPERQGWKLPTALSRSL